MITRIGLALLLLPLSPVMAEELRVPAFTAYLEPDVHGARVSAKSGITGWTNDRLHVLWFGELKAIGSVQAAVSVRLPEGAESVLHLTFNGTTRTARVRGLGGTNAIRADFGSFSVAAPGYQRFLLSQEKPAQTSNPGPQIEALLLDGPATMGAHFNLKPRRNAASVHLTYPIPGTNEVAAFYCEATGLEDPLWTYYMACGWHRGYFGMQVNSPTERRIIFSVWDSGKEAIDRGKVNPENRVTLLAKGEAVDAGDFGNEGTGGHSHLVYPWKTGETQRFLVTAQPTNQTFTIYSGYWFHPEKKQWQLISSWRAPKDGRYLRGLYSFSENFGGDNGHRVRKARFGNQWIRNAQGEWIELTTAGFSHDATGKTDRLDRFMGVENEEFFLSHGGFLPGSTRFGERFERPTRGQPPEIILPKNR